MRTAPEATQTRGSETELAALIARQRPGFSLEQGFYQDPDIFRRDIERIFLRHWLCVGHVSDFAAAGDFALAELAEESAIVVRGEDGALNALINVCRHRGSRICTEARGRTASLICPYHGWIYGLDGTLQSARHMPEGFDRASHGLRCAHVRVVEGLVLISFAVAPLALDNAVAILRACFGPFGWPHARVAHRERYRIAANWKLAVENYLECYHCAPAHPNIRASTPSSSRLRASRQCSGD